MKSAKKTTMRKFMKKQMLTYIGAGFGLVVGLAWNNAINALIGVVFPSKGLGVFAQFIYAFILTITIGAVLYYVNKLVEEDETDDKSDCK